MGDNCEKGVILYEYVGEFTPVDDTKQSFIFILTNNMNTHQHASLASREPWSWNPSSHAGSNATLQNQQMLDQLKNQQQQKLRRQQQQQQQQQLQQRRWFNSDMNKKRISGFRGPTMPPRPMSSSSWTAVSILVMVQGAIILLQHQQHREERQTNDPDRKNSSKSILSKTNSQRFSSSKHLPPLQLTSTTEVDVLVEAPKGKKPWSMHGLLPSIPVPALQQNPTVASSSSSTMKLFPHLAELVDNRAYMESATEVVDDGTGTSQSGRSKGGFYLHNLFRSPASSSTNEEKQQKQQPRSVDKKSSLVKRSLTRRRSLMIARELEKAAEEEASLETKYKVHWRRPLGEGTFGAVYSATDRTTGRSVAVKKIYKQCTDQVSFQNEIGALLEIRKHGGHPNLCGLHGAFADHDPDGHFYLILDLIAGGELFNHLCEQGPYSEADAARLIREVASAMNFMHGLGLVHGDLKPENLMLSTRGKASSVVKVVDFGCAQRFDLPKEESKLDQSKPFLWMGSKPNDNATNNEKSTESKMSTGGRATALTPAYSSPEVLKQKREQAELSEDDDDDSSVPLDPSFDMWALGVILYILLTATHPFDLHGNATDEEIEASIVSGERPPLGQSELTEHLSADAVQVIELLLQWNPNDRLTAHQLLEHRWVRGETARTHKIADSDKRLSSYRAFQTKLQAKAFADMVALSSGPDVDADNQDETTTAIRENKKIMKPKTSGSFSKESSQGGLDGSNRTVSGRIGNRAISTNDGAVVSAPSDNNAMMRTSIIERAFQKFAPDHRGYIPAKELRKLSGEDNAELVGDLSLSGFSDILSEHMKNKYYPKGHVIYNEGEIGNAMFFLNSGSIEISTKDGYRAERKSGAFFGEGALLNPSKTRSASIKCLTPIHAIEISREYFDKYIATEQGT